ncbi:WxL domain-containing protein [Enterococcus hulanensis]|uniref:WxL domain-containing protein n=1 Tax=Enterococcus hulanensis TaxID=2559929 RepID=A0ABU3EWF5_9ENTE|nr:MULTISPECIES: WxL domain-containing protein [Enterococcus]MBX8937969.1 WxL domain-containing protein [Enterococcus gilvus]MDT2599200.1 WxL domain-containing protein [Enterococcus hulanensis]MDT2608607.1 WxL domain-containing protein [Enterococcus hulanensis]MDT2616362.1 WxL domain-containing protein [Enterococcus hulanensis]MDT2627598.1 WxL domain-containing protein [Enterococcus hulanensis]
MKKQGALLIAGLFAGSLFAFSTGAHAVDTTGTVDYTDGGITFDPQDPENASASLPKDLNFGSHAIQTTADETWTATSDGVQTSPVTTGQVAVSDNRGDSSTGWTVKVNEPTQFTANSKPLTGAELSFTVGALTNNVNSLPTGTRIADSAKTALLVNQTVTVLTAQPNEGAGETALPITKFELNVPKNTAKEQAQYQTTLVWTFSATPS